MNILERPKICISVAAREVAGLKAALREAEALADIIEIRFDALDDPHHASVRAAVEEFRASFSGKILVTFRPKNNDQGGFRELTDEERVRFWSSASGLGDWCDTERDLEFSSAGFEKSIRSHHFFDRVPTSDELERAYADLAADPNAVIKIAARADDAADSIAVWKLLVQARSDGREMIPIAMGEAGKWTRILGPAHGALMTYAPVTAGLETAPGQISAADLRNVYGIDRLRPETRVFGILGSNTTYSMSPHIHNAAFIANGEDAVFVPIQVSDLDEFVRRMVAPATREIDLNFAGFAVTIPHKVAIMKHLSEVDANARAIGAVNTVLIRAGEMHGFNTDAHGFIEPLRSRIGSTDGLRVAVFGAGGAARACVHALTVDGASVTIFARDPEKAKALAADFGASAGDSARAERPFDIVVNTTPLGTTGELADQSAVPDEFLKGARIAYDLVYNPFETKFLRAANAAGIETIGGFEMLIGQAVKQQMIWTGREAPVDRMKKAALARLNA